MENWENYSLNNIINEIWMDLINYDGLYEISNYGRVKSLPKPFFTAKGAPCLTKEKIIKPRLCNERSGGTNVYISLSCNGEKRYNLSKQVALHFMKEYNNEALYFVDGNRNNCNIDNLIKVDENNVLSLYDNNIIVLPNKVSDLLFSMNLKKCSICKKIKNIKEFSKSNRNKNINNNCQKCVNAHVYDWRHNLTGNKIENL